MIALARVIAAQAAEIRALKEALSAMQSGPEVTPDKRGLSEVTPGTGISTIQGDSNALEAYEALRSEGVDPSDIAASFSTNTKRAYRAAWQAFVTYCEARGLQAMPATPADVASYLKERARDGGAKMATLKVKLAAITQAHRINGFQLDRNAPALHFALRALAREIGIAQEGKAALSTADIEAMLTVLPRDIAGARDKALLLIGFAGGFRRSELSALDVDDIAWHRDGIRVHVRRSKTDQEAAGADVGILYGTRNATCPVRALKEWLRVSGLTRGALFRAVLHNKVRDERLSDRGIYDVVKRSASAAGLDAARYGAHSLRSGHVTTALDNGGDLVRTKDQVRHAKLDTTLGYKRKTDVFKNNSSGKLGL